MSGARRSRGSAMCTAPRARRRQPLGIGASGALGSLAILLLVLGPAVAHAQTEVVEYYATDALGSIRVVYDANGVELARADYLPFGEEFSSSAGLPPERFTGQARDGEVGLDYLNARMLRPALGVFTATDPVAGHTPNPQSWNRYAYVRNAPATLSDPTGETVVHPNCFQASGAYWCPGDFVLPAPNYEPFDANSPGYGGGEIDWGEARYEANVDAVWDVGRQDAYFANSSIAQGGQGDHPHFHASNQPTDVALNQLAMGVARRAGHLTEAQTYGEFFGASAIGGLGIAGILGREAVGHAAVGLVNSVLGRQSFLFGSRGLLNSGRNIRIGHSRDGGEAVFRISGELLKRPPLSSLPLVKDGHLILRRLGPL